MSIGTRIFTWARGELVGKDSEGNRYFTEKKAVPGRRRRRWVLYSAGPIDASRVPAEWHGWLHYTLDAPLPTPEDKPWVKEHKANLTGTSGAYLPPGHDRRGGLRPVATGDYEAWQP